jgi:hypothetical protein
MEKHRMTSFPLFRSGLVLAGAMMLLAGCEVVRENTSCQTPPALRVEVPPKPPVSEQEQIWQPGHWEWNGSSYSWREGRWVLREGRTGLWVHGHWVRDRVPGPCRWVPAFWQQ